jgi:RHS repeat-associated protein
LVEQKDYYAFGMENPALSTKALKANYYENRYKFNGIELDTTFSFDKYEARFRDYDPEIGRWIQVDPKINYSESPYVSMSDNPIRFGDPLGDTILDAQIKGDKNWGKVYNTWFTSKAGKSFTKLYSPGGKYGKTTVEFKVGITDARGQGQTKVFDINRKDGTSTELETGKDYKGIDKVADGKSSTEYLKFEVTLREGDEANTPDKGIEYAESVLHETQHVRMDQQTLSTNIAVASANLQHYWMKDINSQWYQERANFYNENKQMWQADYDRQKAQGKVNSEADYIRSKINDFRN